jgi:hypothetical protein
MPICISLYENNDSYIIVEVNTGTYKGSIKVISLKYSKIDDVMKDPNIFTSGYLFLRNHIIYNDMKLISKL